MADRAVASRRGTRALVVVVVLLVLVAVAWVVAEVAGRAAAEDYVRGQVRQSLGLSPDARVDVGFDDGSFVLQAITGTLDTVEVYVPDARFGDVEGDLYLTADTVPLDPAEPVADLDIRLRLDAAQATAIVRSSPGLGEASVSLEEPLLRVGTEFSVLGANVAVSVGLTPSAEGGALQLDPADLTVNGAELDLDAVEDSPFGPLVEPLVGPKEICVASYLPQPLTLESATVSGPSLDLVVGGRDIVLASTDVSTTGSC